MLFVWIILYSSAHLFKIIPGHCVDCFINYSWAILLFEKWTQVFYDKFIELIDFMCFCRMLVAYSVYFKYRLDNKVTIFVIYELLSIQNCWLDQIESPLFRLGQVYAFLHNKKAVFIDWDLLKSIYDNLIDNSSFLLALHKI